jgi:hypothetical protein
VDEHSAEFPGDTAYSAYVDGNPLPPRCARS